MEESITSLSIVIPIFKGSNFIEKLLKRVDKTKNILSKSKVNLIEVICVCDEPIDDSLKIIKKLQLKFNYLRVIELSSNKGQHLATSAGIMSSIGDWICTIDEDLQHDPINIIDLLLKSTKFSKDLVYARSKFGTHSNSFYRNFFSKLSKNLISLITGHNTKITSSYRLIRGNLARSCATCMDKFQYLDNLLFYQTSKHRRGYINLNLIDKRDNKSGYKFNALLSHFFKNFYSSEIGVKRFFLFLFAPIFLSSSLVGIFLIKTAQDKSVYISNPGWLSIFTMQFIVLIILGLFFTYSVKVYSIIALRSLAMAPYLLIDRSKDNLIYENLKKNIDIKNN